MKERKRKRRITLDDEAMFFNECIAGASSRQIRGASSACTTSFGSGRDIEFVHSLRQTAVADPDSVLAEAMNTIPLRFCAAIRVQLEQEANFVAAM